MWTSSIAVAARTAASPPSAPAQSRTSSGRSRLPPAARVAAASAPSSSPWPRLCSRSSSSTSPSRAGSQRLEASSTAVTGGGTAEWRVTRRTPLWIAMIPPARTVQRIRSRPARVHLLRQAARGGEAAHRLGQVGVGLGVAGERAEQRHDAVEPERVEGRERRPGRLGDLEDHQAPAGPQDPGHLAQAAVEVGEVAHAEADRDRVEAAGVVGKAERVGPLEADRRRRRAAAAFSRARSSIGSEKSQPTTWPAGRDPAGQLERQVAGAAADVEGRVARAQLGPVGGALAPAVVQAGGHHRVEQRRSGRRRGRTCG